MIGMVCFALAMVGAQLPAAAQATPMTLQQAGARQPPNFEPVHEGKIVDVRGQVSAPAYHFLNYTFMGLQDATGGGILRVNTASKALDGFHAGDDIAVTGRVNQQAGLAVIDPEQIRVVAHHHESAPSPRKVPLEGLLGFTHIGQLVQTEGVITEIGDNTGGPYLLIADGSNASLKAFIPHPRGQAGTTLVGYALGDKVQVTGVAAQYCPRPPYNKWFEILVRQPADIIPLEKPWFVPPGFIAAGVGLLAGVGLYLWMRERRVRAQRERLRRVYQLGEEILGSGAPETILKRLGEALPGILGVSGVQLFVYNRAAKTLDPVSSGGPDSPSVSLASPSGGPTAGAAACFHYRKLLVIPDSSRSPFPVAPVGDQPGPKALMFVPMMAQSEVIGVLELDQNNRNRDFSTDEQALAQHLGNQIGVAVRLLDQRSVQEQLYRSEKLAAVGRLISGVVNELQNPLASIAELAEMAQHRPHICPAEREIAAIRGEASKASAIVARLVSFAAEQVETRPVDINGLIRNLIEFRGHDCKASGIRVRDLSTRDVWSVLGSQGQLEQVFLNLLVHAEQALASSAEKSITVRTSLLGKRILVEIGFSAGPDFEADGTAAAVLAVARGVIAGHGGEVRLARSPSAPPHFEVELPWVGRDRTAGPVSAGHPRDGGRHHTIVLIEPDEAAQRQLLAMLSGRGHRVVPINNSDTGMELAQRMRFDFAFCSVHSPGLNWVELSEQLQSRVGTFVLLSDGYDAELVADFETDGRFVLPKPVQESELDRVLGNSEPFELPRSRTA
jgi:CheY-like chemotaxis protein